jgi:Ni/Fe-hydrogenase subunit HybB-like protein
MIRTLHFPRLTLWQWIFAMILVGGAAALYVRIFYGLGGSTNLSDQFPWGLWKGFNVLTGIALGAGGFTLAATVHIFNIESYKPIMRSVILTAFLGYSLMCVALFIDIGQPFRIWHPIVFWNVHSVLFEVAWCVMLYTTVLIFEFLPVICERFGWKTTLKWVRRISVPLVIFGVVLSTLHQSSLGSLFLIVPYKLYPLWYTPLLPVLFFISAICAGLSVVIFMSWQSSKAFGRQLPLPLLSSMARVLAVILSFYLAVRMLDLVRHGAVHLFWINRRETYLFWLEIALLVVPTVLLYRRSFRSSAVKLYWASVMVMFGFIANRLNVSIVGLEAGSGVHYVPRWSEVMITLSLLAIAFAAFRTVAKYFPVFPSEQPVPVEQSARAPQTAALPAPAHGSD